MKWFSMTFRFFSWIGSSFSFSGPKARIAPRIAAVLTQMSTAACTRSLKDDPFLGAWRKKRREASLEESSATNVGGLVDE